MVKKFIAVFFMTVILALSAFIAGYYFSSGGFRGLPGLWNQAEEGGGEPVAGQEDEEGYRIQIMQEINSEKELKENSEETVKETREERDGQVVIRRPFGRIILSLVIDGSHNMSSPEGVLMLQDIGDGVADFLKKLPREVLAGVRTMGGAPPGTCRDSKILVPMGENERHFMDDLHPEGPRNISRALYLAAGDMATQRGRKGIVVVTTGREECGEWPCEKAQALFSTKEGIRTYLLQIVRDAGGTGDQDEQLEVAGDEVLAEPQPSMETVGSDEEGSLGCLGEVGGGFKEIVHDRAGLVEGLDRVVSELSRNVVVRLFRSPGNELVGQEDLQMARWKVDVVPLDRSKGKELSSSDLPARFRLPPGRYGISGTYGGVSSDIRDLEITAGQEVEVHLNYRISQLVILGGEREWPGGDSDCMPEIKIHPVNNPLFQTDEKCGLPNQFILSPGEYFVSVMSGDYETRYVEVGIVEGGTVVMSVSPGEDPKIISVDKAVVKN